ncbi:hypothetical protein BKA82DRAFT_118832 [Pisolithus tinctorius]|uniref:Uncharacterized protein n=1 Tax=Pisolithus tinctorius Marx 270 TaxID=870435 RepID=A0A0C3KZQ3_PISTI|nr:hypothetical protein BKA82DRAFT_118832 [Pisolithus tinctorius]KIO14987.1 hypothetical protein M404DRAFT_118832 [Pisolithus tinctorius Marx 270]
MSDVRSLLKAKRQEARVDHPLAAYTSSGQLRCVICETSVKHAAAWQGHVGSKAHRVNAARMRGDRVGKQQGQPQDLIGEETSQRAKRRADELELAVEASGASQKRLKTSPEAGTDTATASTLLENLPADFFSDSPYALDPSPGNSHDSEKSIPLGLVKPISPRDPTLDEEWIRFQKDVLNTPDHREAYDRATVVSDPQLISDVAEGFPKRSQSVEVQAQQDETAFRSDETSRQRKEHEERELILDRLVEEERAQEEADMRVKAMRNRLDAIRRKRAAIQSEKLK